MIDKIKINRSFNMQPEGFHGDRFLISLVNMILSGSKNFIETGTDVASTLKFVSDNYKNISCYSCELDEEAFKHAVKNTSNNSNVTLYNTDSITFLNNLNTNLFNEKTLFWLDAHGTGFKWPLIDEINFILSNFKFPAILIDDFKVPKRPEFKYDSYEKQICSFNYIKDKLKFNDFNLFYPNYNEITSSFHPLVGWGLIMTNNISFKQIPNFIINQNQI